ncbi:PREDICTED: P2X purinoceptor 4 [Thamnophis sirtalis]|uniref:P2X purinoceptor 4 n=1 Tax=Thamnophis sirtalis TaxID=35019 RepID=A0A6I9YZX9_9SAUR|nr:PREDICTED: P2X purinoceptor 4 [Thamnophis sirtalis]
MVACSSFRSVFEYETNKVVRIYSVWYSSVKWAIHFLVFLYVSVNTCEVSAWCPVESAKTAPAPAILDSAENFTVLIKNNIHFPKFDYTKKNIPPEFNISCTYHKHRAPLCPIFRLGDILEEAGEKFSEMAIQGGVMGLQIRWDCDLDTSASRCVPKYSFRRIDNKDPAHSISPGFNFRFAKYYRTATGVQYRTFVKAYGIRFDIMVFGTAGKFDIIPTIISIGSGFALFGMATIFCDIIVLYIMKKRYLYREKKYKRVNEYELLRPQCDDPSQTDPAHLTQPR